MIRHRLAITAVAAAAALTSLPAVAAADTVAIVGATVWTRPGQRLDGATVVIRDGKIAAVGVGVAVPAGATRIDGRGKIVTAGLVDAVSRLGLAGIELEAASVDGSFGASGRDRDDEVHAAYRAIDGHDAGSVAIPVARTGGVTSAVSVPVGTLIAGQSAWFPLAEGSAGATPARAPAAMHAALGRDATSAGSRGVAIERLRELFDDVGTYARNRGGYERNQSRHLVAERLDLEALVPVLRGQLPLIVTANAEADIRAALTLARSVRLRLVIAGGTEAWKLAAELAAARVAVILDPTENLPAELDALDVRDDTATLLAAAGVDVAISTLGDPAATRNLRQLAGNAVAEGLPWDRALAALTTVPAAIYGVTDRGTVEAGKVADVVVWSGDPLELTTRAEIVIIGGVVQGTDSHQTRLLRRYRTLPRR